MLILGYAIIHLPGFCQGCYLSIRKFLAKREETNKDNHNREQRETQRNGNSTQNNNIIEMELGKTIRKKKTKLEQNESEDEDEIEQQETKVNRKKKVKVQEEHKREEEHADSEDEIKNDRKKAKKT